MKRTTFIIALALFSCISLVAQEKTFRFGPTLGVEFPFTVGSLDLGNGSEPTQLIRGQIGFAFNISFSDKIGLQPELLYQSRVIDGDLSGIENSAYSNSYGYVLIPIMFDLKLVKGLSLQAGPRIGILVTTDEDDFYASNGPSAQSTEVAAMFGPQYVTPFGLFFNIRAEYTFTSVYSSGDLNGGGVGVSLGWLF